MSLELQMLRDGIADDLSLSVLGDYYGESGDAREVIIRSWLTPARPKDTLCNVHIRWMIRNDMPEILQTELSFGDGAWREEKFLTNLWQKNTIGMVAEAGERVVAHMVYELRPKSLHIMRMAVNPRWRRMGVGRRMMDKLESKIGGPGMGHRRKELTAALTPDELEMILFLRHEGFRAAPGNKGSLVNLIYKRTP